MKKLFGGIILYDQSGVLASRHISLYSTSSGWGRFDVLFIFSEMYKSKEEGS